MQIGIKATANHSKRTFTIRTQGIKYRTYPMSKIEFEESLYFTRDDWSNFLKTGEYYAVK